MTVVVQVNGKLRDRLEVAAGTPDAELVALARALPRVAPAVDGRQVVREVVVPDRLVNLVVEVGRPRRHASRARPVTARWCSARRRRPSVGPWIGSCPGCAARAGRTSPSRVALALVAWRVGAEPAAGAGQPAAAAAATAPAAVARHGAGRRPTRPGPRGRRGPAPGRLPIGPGARVIEAIRRAGGPDAAGRPRRPQPGGDRCRTASRCWSRRGRRRAGAGAAAGRPPGPRPAGQLSTRDAGAAGGARRHRPDPRPAHRGVARRPRRLPSVDELLDVPGIGPARLEALRAKVVP